ncbi:MULTISPECIES: polyprenyl synthetase family protein [unclassified Streptococcus]|uniref:polyprenyl synthetase family protein n=1 Tax=unclassified Streptococcus TaxID=2608887 RepID=UPI001072CC4C|nr:MULTISPECIES: polyprenyl synthetase family protein [unclassified Streptococcus]MBF0786345.1 polyprenyl synthetase family protein [Streptococcus sp. 19428wC2_LYSM12]MCQ9212454.1 polyprenyl synthetase family protein [Streptococcus sp. B01]MCQ9213792.1 polyprenyl synthetase family protein [Streptococcus sp. O1]TFV06755.1 polyprenyl synthetase family protein [Streptococcus sp. LYSM12]
MSSYWSGYPDLEEKLDSVRTVIEQKMHIRNQSIERAVVSLNNAGGKYLRPAFFFLFAAFGDAPKIGKDQLVTAAASLEVLHLATLVHDDVIDDSPLRRGQVTIQSHFGKDVAVYTGDLLFTVFFDLLLESMSGSPYLRVNAKTMKKILLGELEQMSTYHNQEQTIHGYLRTAAGKTAALFKLAAREGAYFGGADVDTIRLAGHVGFYIGIAFQMIDDLLDYTEDKEALNKPVLEDISQGIYNLPLICALQKNPAVFRPYLDKQQAMTVEDVEAVVYLMKKEGGLEEARMLAARFTQKAVAVIAQLPLHPAKDRLLQMTERLLERSS